MAEQRFELEQEDGPVVHVWENADGEVWACCAADHGPMCRLCQRVDKTLMGLLQNVDDGNMLARARPDGEMEFRMTIKGQAAAENLVHGTAEGASIWADLQAHDEDIKRGLKRKRKGDADA